MREFISKIKKVLYVLLILASLALRLYNIRTPLANEQHAFRQTQTAITIQNYFTDGYSFFHYETPVLGAPWQVQMEAPIYQTIVYIAMRILRKTNIDLWGKLVSILFFYCSAFMLKLLADEITNNEASWFVVLIYLFTPFNIYWSRAVLIDFTSVFFALAYVYGFLRWMKYRNGTVWYLVALFSGIAGYLCKATTMFAYVYFLAFLIMAFWKKLFIEHYEKSVALIIRKAYSENLGKLLEFIILCIVPVAIGALWIKYTDGIKSLNPYTAFLTSKALSHWNFGTLQQRLDYSRWAVIFRRFFQCGGSWTLFVFLSFLYLYSLKEIDSCTYVIVVSILSALLTIITVYNLYYRHNYYFIAVSPLICISVGCLLYEVVKRLEIKGHPAWRLIAFFIIAVCCAESLFSQNTEYIASLRKTRKDNQSCGTFLGKITNHNERFFIRGEDWSPETLYYANRKGIMAYYPEKDFYNAIMNDKTYTTFIFHDAMEVDGFMKNVCIEYPAFSMNDIYILKLYESEADAGIQNIVFHPCKQEENKYRLSGSRLLKFDFPSESKAVCGSLFIEDESGAIKETKIVFPANKTSIYVNLEGIGVSPVALYLETNNLEITVSQNAY